MSFPKENILSASRSTVAPMASGTHFLCPDSWKFYVASLKTFSVMILQNM